MLKGDIDIGGSASTTWRKTVGKWLAWLALYVFVAALALGANPFHGKTTGPVDLLASFPGWNPDGHRVKVRHIERSDVVDFVLPEWMESRRQIRDGIFPLWNPLAGGGHAAILNPVYAELTPGFLLFAAAPDPADGFYFAVLCSLVIAGLGMHCLVARYRSPGVAVFAGISYMMCGFIAAWLYWPHAHTAIWVPWILFYADKYVRDDCRVGFVGVSLCVALMFLGGFPFVVALGLGALVVFALTASMARGVRFVFPKAAMICVAAMLGLALCAVPLLTLQSMLADSEIGYRSGGSPFRFASHARLLLGPWLDQNPHVESNMYPGTLALAFTVFGILPVLRWRADALTTTGLSLFIVGAVLTFGILPVEVGARLPVLSFNPWSRAILLLDMGIILLAATGLEWLIKRVPGRAWGGVVAAGLACTIQAVDLGDRFREFNGRTRDDYFYHVSPALAFLKNQVKPFQYVAQDHSYFMISGTLNAVGLGDWFSHGLRSPPMGALLQSLAKTPFKTKTATMVRIDNYNWHSDIADAAAMCYAIFPSTRENVPVVARTGPGRRVPMPSINNVDVRQPLELAAPASLMSVGLRLATYRVAELDGVITLALKNHDGRTILGTANVAGSTVYNNAMAVFRFGQVVHLEPGLYMLDVRYAPGHGNKPLTIWTLAGTDSGLSRDGKQIAGTLDYVLYAPSNDFPETLFAHGGVTVARNAGCADGAYWIDGSGERKSSGGQGAVSISHYEPHDFTLDLSSTEAGYVVVPMRYQQGWKASVNGKTAPLRTMNGVFPAVEVLPGQTRIRMSYRPPGLGYGLALSGFALVALLWIASKHARRR